MSTRIGVLERALLDCRAHCACPTSLAQYGKGDFNSAKRAGAKNMRITTGALFSAVAMVFASHVLAADDPKAEFDRRSAERYVALFQALDLNTDGMVSRAEAQGDLNFGPAFDDMDINRDGFVTVAELQRFIGQRFGLQV